MRNFDLTPLYRSTVGFDRLANVMNGLASHDVNKNTYPPYNIEKTADDTYCISVAVAGFADSELDIEVRDQQLIVKGKKADEDLEKSYLHRGIASRSFEKRFQLADHVYVAGATTENGLLHINMVREIPEALKPRTIEIASGDVINAKASEKKLAKSN